MSDIAIRVNNLGKLYRIGAEERQPRNLTAALRSLAASPFAYLGRMLRPPTDQETLWALRDVSFESLSLHGVQGKLLAGPKDAARRGRRHPFDRAQSLPLRSSQGRL